MKRSRDQAAQLGIRQARPKLAQPCHASPRARARRARFHAQRPRESTRGSAAHLAAKKPVLFEKHRKVRPRRRHAPFRSLSPRTNAPSPAARVVTRPERWHAPARAGCSRRSTPRRPTRRPKAKQAKQAKAATLRMTRSKARRQPAGVAPPAPRRAATRGAKHLRARAAGRARRRAEGGGREAGGDQGEGIQGGRRRKRRSRAKEVRVEAASRRPSVIGKAAWSCRPKEKRRGFAAQEARGQRSSARAQTMSLQSQRPQDAPQAQARPLARGRAGPALRAAAEAR